VLHLDLAYSLSVVSKGKHTDTYQVDRTTLSPGEGGQFWTDYASLVSINLVTITQKIASYNKKKQVIL